MTIVFAERVDSEERTQLLQWGISLLLVVVIHASVALWLFSREAQVQPNKPPPPAAFLDLPPLSAGPNPPLPIPAPPSVAPPVPKLPAAPKPEPEKPASPKAEAPIPIPPHPQAPLIAPPKPAPAPTPKVAPPRPQAPKPAPQQHTQPKAPPKPTPVTPGSATPYVDPMLAWQIAAGQRLENFKKQSQAATWRGEVGVVGLQITIDRNGNILSSYISNPSGYSTLDNQALTMCRLARRLPPLPPEFKQPTYAFHISIEFSLY